MYNLVDAKLAFGIMHNIPGYSTYNTLKDRCSNPNSPDYKYYGGRGITVSNEWSTFEQFYASMGPQPKGLSIERINNDEGYGPDNCKWATILEQAANRRPKAIGPILNYNGVEQDLLAWSKEIGIDTDTLRHRLTAGWSIKAVLTTPKKAAVINSKAKVITYNGETKTVSAWANSLGVTANTLHHRLRKGWPLERVLK